MPITTLALFYLSAASTALIAATSGARAMINGFNIRERIRRRVFLEHSSS
jgi:hypothetical protein